MAILNVSLFIMLLINSFLALFSRCLSVTVHEHSHKLALKFSARILHKQYPKPKIKYYPLEHKSIPSWLKYPRCSAFTSSPLYEYFEEHRQEPTIQKHIKLNAISGILGETLLNLSLFSYMCLWIKLSPLFIMPCIATALIFSISVYDFFKNGSDYKFFKHPEQFKYDPNFKK